MQTFKTDVAVLMLFFNRPDKFQQVFEQVRQARPSHLFLYQDGPRGERDMPGIMACRKIAENIDWECDVQRHYCEKNQGCDPSEYLSQRWAFDDYFFTSTFSIWGWASWRRVIDTWDGTYSFLDDPNAVKLLNDIIRQRKYRKSMMDLTRKHKASGIPYYETIFWASMMLNNGLAIMPKRNLINNIGLTADSTHYTASEKTTPRGLRKIFTMKRFELQFPLKHPRYVIDNVAYKERFYRRSAWGHPWIKVGRSLEELFLNLRYGNFRVIGKAITNRLHKAIGRR